MSAKKDGSASLKRKPEGTPGRGGEKHLKCDGQDMAEVCTGDAPVTLASIQALLKPLMEDMSDMKHQLRDLSGLELRLMDRIDQRVQERTEALVVSHIKSSSSEMEKSIQNLKSSLDRLTDKEEAITCSLQAVGFGIPMNVDRKSFREHLQAISPAHKICSLRLVSNKDRTSSLCLLRFSSREERDKYLQVYKTEVRSFQGHNISMRTDMSKLQRQRNDSLKQKAKDLTQKSPGQKVDIDWLKRSITVNGETKWKQKRDSVELVQVL